MLRANHSPCRSTVKRKEVVVLQEWDYSITAAGNQYKVCSALDPNKVNELELRVASCDGRRLKL